MKILEEFQNSRVDLFRLSPVFESSCHPPLAIYSHRHVEQTLASYDSCSKHMRDKVIEQLHSSKLNPFHGVVYHLTVLQ